MTRSRPSRTPLRTLLAPLVGALLLAVSAGPAAAAGGPDVTLPPPARDAYVAMGDSFSAGTGTGQFDIDADCQRSTLAYPALIGAQRPNTMLTFVACGGGVTTETMVKTQVPALDQSTDFVTMTVGGNDIGFGTIASTCIGGTEEQCLGVVGTASQFVVTKLPGRLATAYDAVRARVHKAEAIVVGYPKFYADDFTPCMQAIGITAPEASALNELVTDLDAVIADEAEAAGFTYVDPLEAFTGHDMCAAEPWINGYFAPTTADIYHPTAAAYANGFTPLVLSAMQTREPSVSQVHRR